MAWADTLLDPKMVSQGQHWNLSLGCYQLTASNLGNQREGAKWRSVSVEVNPSKRQQLEIYVDMPLIY